MILVDTIGELSAVWGLADVAFVGGSLMPGRGGQNMMEPAAFGAAVLFGPHTANFREVVEQLLGRDGAREVADAAELAAALLADLDDPEVGGRPRRRSPASTSWPRTEPRAGPSPRSTGWSPRKTGLLSRSACSS